MSVIGELRKMPEARSGALAPLKQIGLQRGGRTFVRALIQSGFKKDQIARQFMLAFWKNLGKTEAIIDGENRLSFAEFRTRVLRLANVMNDLGLQSGDAMAELLYNGSTWFEAMGACTVMGIHMPMLNWHLRSKELAHCINASKPKILLFDVGFLEKIEPIINEIPSVKHFIIVGAEVVPDGMLAFEDLMASANSDTLPPGKFDMAPRPFSGGTTGTPKYMNINRDRLSSDSEKDRRGASKEEVQHLLLMQLTAFHWYKLGKIKDPKSHNVRSLIPGPLYHAGVQVGVLPFFVGGTVVPMHRFTPEGFLQLIEQERINWVFVAPTMLERILALPEEVKCRYNLSTMQTLICAAAPCHPNVKQGINALFRQQGAPADIFHEYYAASETGLVSILAPEDYKDHPERYKSVGKIRGCNCRIYDPDTGKWAPSGKEGKVIMRTPMVFGLEYAGVDEEKMLENFVEVEDQLWYDDGLIGYVDDDGYLYLTSRVKEMIITGGVNLFPNEIEDVIKFHPKVLDVAVVRAPDKDLGEIAAAVIQLKEGEESSADEILEFCKEKGLYGFKLPKIIEFGNLPRNLAGKLPKKEVEARFWKDEESFG